MDLSTIRTARYYPELIPEATFVDIPAGGAEASPSPLELKNLQEETILYLTNLAVEQNSAIETRVSADGISNTFRNDALPDMEPQDALYFANNEVKFTYFSDSSQSDVKTSFGTWLMEPTVAHKIKHGLPLSQEEQKINEDLNISNTVDKGLLPLPFDYMIDREYRGQIIGEEVKSLTPSGGLSAGVPERTEGLTPKTTDEFIVLTGIAATSGTASDNIEVEITRDTDAPYFSINTFPLSVDDELEMFIPALNEIRLKVVADASVSPFVLRYRYLRVKMSNILRIRFGLMSEAGAPGDLYRKVRGGII